MRAHLRPALTLTLVLCVITGLIYPGLVTALAQLFFPRQANGSLVRVGGRVVGSQLIGQRFMQPYYFHPRPSAAGAGYDATASGGSNRGPTDRALANSLIAEGVNAAVVEDGAVKGRVPADMVTRSASGLDPDISPATAILQISRVARARRVSEARLRSVVERWLTPRQFGVLGEPRVNVLMLNIAVDSAFPLPVARPAGAARQ